MKAVLLVNMGSPASANEMKYFLKNMFLDPAILPMPYFMRAFLSFVISSTRYKNSWSKYELIGGSPLKETDNDLTKKLSDALGESYFVANAFSYTQPQIPEIIGSIYSKGIRDIHVIPLYPQFSLTTTSSVKKNVYKTAGKYKDLNIIFTESFYNNKYFIEFWKSAIELTITKYKLKTQNSELKTILLFSAHSIPEYNISKGDSYVKEVNESARLIAESLGLEFKVSYQSKIGRVKWVEPDTKVLLKDISVRSSQFSVLIVPISFLSENLETLYDLEHDIIPYAKNELRIKKIFRVEIPQSHPMLIRTFTDIILNQD